MRQRSCKVCDWAWQNAYKESCRFFRGVEEMPRCTACWACPMPQGCRWVASVSLAPVQQQLHPHAWCAATLHVLSSGVTLWTLHTSTTVVLHVCSRICAEGLNMSSYN